MGKFLTLCWAIWGARNKFVVAGEEFDPVATVAYATKTSNEVCMENHASDGGAQGGGGGSSHSAHW